MGCEGISAQVLGLCQAERALKTKLLQFLCAKALQSNMKAVPGFTKTSFWVQYKYLFLGKRQGWLDFHRVHVSESPTLQAWTSFIEMSSDEGLQIKS